MVLFVVSINFAGWENNDLDLSNLWKIMFYF